MISETDSTALSPTTTANHHDNDLHFLTHDGKSNNNNGSQEQSSKSPSKFHNGKCKEPAILKAPETCPTAATTTTTTTTTTTSNGGKGSSVKKRKRFEETIIDGYAIMAFKTWEDLQDELNERSTISNVNNNNINSSEHCTANLDKKPSKSSNHHHKSSSSSASHSEITNQSGSKDPSARKSNSSNNKEHKAKKTVSHSDVVSTKDKSRNKSSSVEKTSKDLKKALEAKELAEKRLSILQEKLKQEQNRNRNHNSNEEPGNENHNDVDNNQDSRHHNHHQHNDSSSSNRGSINHDDNSNNPIQSIMNQNSQHHANHPTSNIHNQFSSSHFPAKNLSREEQATIHSRPNGLLGQDLLKDPTINSHHKPAQYSPFHLNSHLQHRNHNPMSQQPPQTPPNAQLSGSRLQHQQPQSPMLGQYPKHPSSFLNPSTNHHHLIQAATAQSQQNANSLPPMQQHPSNQQSQSRQSVGTPPIGSHPSMQLSSQYPPHLQRPSLSHPMQVPNMPPTHPSATNPMHSAYPHQQSSSMMTSMSLSSLPSPYSCPPSIYITDTISRQTSIIPPPPPVGLPALEAPPPPTVPSIPGARFGHSSVLQSMAPYSPAMPPHHSAYYPILPTERSFIEFARSYTAPSHAGYHNMMNSFSASRAPAPNPIAAAMAASASPNPFDRWPRMAMDHQRAVTRYDSLYQSATSLPERFYSSYPSARPPSFPASLFPPPF